MIRQHPSARLGDDQRTRQNVLARVRIAPAFPKSRKREDWRTLRIDKNVGLFFALLPGPFVKTRRRYDAAPAAIGAAKHRLLGDRFYARVERRRKLFQRLLPPIRHQAPTDAANKLTAPLCIMADHVDERSRRDVVASLQVLRRADDAQEGVYLLPRVMLGESSADDSALPAFSATNADPYSAIASTLADGRRLSLCLTEGILPKHDLTAEELRRVLHYNPNAGDFTWLVARRASEVGKRAGGVRPDGYIHIGISGRRYLAHRLAWLYMTGGWPTEQIDHIDRDRSNNSWLNLRLATNSQNQGNRLAISGIRGVYFDKDREKWRAQIVVGNRNTHLGIFATADEAREAYNKAGNEYWGEYFRAA